MLDKRNYELEYIKNLQDRYKRDPGLIERILYAFGLLEALQQSGMPFCFKGGNEPYVIAGTSNEIVNGYRYYCTAGNGCR